MVQVLPRILWLSAVFAKLQQPATISQYVRCAAKYGSEPITDSRGASLSALRINYGRAFAAIARTAPVFSRIVPVAHHASSGSPLKPDKYDHT
jgi:hypothetical protein